MTEKDDRECDPAKPQKRRQGTLHSHGPGQGGIYPGWNVCAPQGRRLNEETNFELVTWLVIAEGKTD